MPLQRVQAFLGLLGELRTDLEVEVQHLPSALQLQRLREGHLDLGIVHGTGRDLEVEAEPMYRGEPLAAVVWLSHRVTAGETARLEDFAGDVLLVVPRGAEPGFQSRVVALLDGAPFREVREAPGPDVRDVLFSVASGQGVTVAPRSSLRLVGELGEIVAARPLAAPASMPDTCLVWPAQRRPDLGGVYRDARDVARELYAASR